MKKFSNCYIACFAAIFTFFVLLQVGSCSKEAWENRIVWSVERGEILDIAEHSYRYFVVSRSASFQANHGPIREIEGYYLFSGASSWPDFDLLQKARIVVIDKPKAVGKLSSSWL